MAKTQYRQKRINVYASDGGITIHGDIHVGAHDLTPEEHKKLVGRVIRGIPKMLEGLPYADFGTDNISIETAGITMAENILTLEQFREWGRQGGRARSARKSKSSAANVAKARIAQARKIIEELEAVQEPVPSPSAPLTIPEPTFNELDTP